MNYRLDRYGNQISQLGYGCMRFTRKGNAIDYEKAEKEVLLAIQQGVNYFDTAYIYPGSEECLGRILEENKCRDRVFIATKLPQYIIRSSGAIDKTFREELSRLRTDHIDYYLMHMFTDYAEPGHRAVDCASEGGGPHPQYWVFLSRRDGDVFENSGCL